VIQDVAGSAEGRALGVTLRFADDASVPAAAAAPQAAPAAGGQSVAALLAGLATLPDAELHALQRELAEAAAAVAAERAARLEARVARLEQRLG
jgi:hypothetical protein